MATSNIRVGDRVAYSAAFCRSIGVYTGDMPHDRGIVEQIDKQMGERLFATVKWTLGSPPRVYIGVLTKKL